MDTTMNESAVATELSAIREIVTQSSQDIAALTQIVKIHEAKFQNTDAAIERISRRAADDNKTPWAVVIAACVLVMGIMSTVGNLAGDGMWRAIDNNKQARKELDINLQREMRDLLVTSDTKTQDLSFLIEAENKLRDTALENRFARIEKILDRITGWQDYKILNKSSGN